MNMKLSSSHDIIIGRGTTRVSGAEQVAQLVKCRLLTVFSEWKQDENLGIPWFDSIFSKNVRLADVETAVANIIRTTNGVRQLISITLDAERSSRTLSVNFSAVSVYGNISELAQWQQTTE